MGGWGGGRAPNVFKRNSISFPILFAPTFIVASMRDGKFAEEIEVYPFLTTSDVDLTLKRFLHSQVRAVSFFTSTQDHARRTEGMCRASCVNKITSLFDKCFNRM